MSKLVFTRTTTIALTHIDRRGPEAWREVRHHRVDIYTNPQTGRVHVAGVREQANGLEQYFSVMPSSRPDSGEWIADGTAAGAEYVSAAYSASYVRRLEAAAR